MSVADMLPSTPLLSVQNATPAILKQTFGVDFLSPFRTKSGTEAASLLKSVFLVESAAVCKRPRWLLASCKSIILILPPSDRAY